MNPTPEQVAQWAREAGFFLYDLTETHGEKVIESDDKDQHAQLHRLVTRAMAEQAEADAKLCDSRIEINQRWGDEERADEANTCGTLIRANAPKVTT